MAIQKCEDLEVYKLAFNLAMDLFKMSKNFPKEELYSLVDQVRRSSRSVAANISEGFAKRKYPDVFLRHLNISMGSSAETLTWLNFARQCNYITKEQHEKLSDQYDKVSAMLYKLTQNWEKF